MKTKVIYQGTDTSFGGGNLYIVFCTNIQDLTDYTAIFKLQNITKTFTDITSKKVTFNLSAQETAGLALGKYVGTLNVQDPDGKLCASFSDTIFDIRKNPNA